MNYICAFSSDAKPLYLADIYRALALPAGAIIHFRYKEKYVGDDILKNLKGLVGQPVIIFLTENNKEDTSIPHKHISIRHAEVSYAEIAVDTSLFHVYLKLGCFCEKELPSNIPRVNKFFDYRDDLVEGNRDRWHHRVAAVKNSFPDVPLFYVKRLTRNSRAVPLKYEDQKGYYIPLEQGKEYQVDYSISASAQGHQVITVHEQTHAFITSLESSISTSADFDDEMFKIFTNFLPAKQQFSKLHFNQSGIYKDIYDVNLPLKISLSVRAALKFGIAVAVAGAAISFSSAGTIWDLETPVWKTAVGFSIFAVSIGYLFYRFNKK